MNDDDDDDAVPLSPEEASERAELHRQRDAKMDEIVALIASQLGHGDITSLTPDQREAIEAEEAEERWMEEAEMADPPVEPTTPLQRLLREHHDLGEMILDIEDEAIDREEDGGSPPD
jgi:hypothetical protein